MSYIVEQKIKGRIYNYKVVSYWDKEKKQARQKREYLGPKNPVKKNNSKIKTELVNKKYGNIFLLNKIVEDLKLSSFLESCFPKEFNNILALAYYSICNNLAFYMYPSWLSEHHIDNSKSLYSSDISLTTTEIGENEKGQYSFFELWCKKCSPKNGVYFDITSISSFATGIDFVERGYNRDKENLSQINMGLICDEKSELPLYYKIYPGSITDVTTLKNTLSYLETIEMVKHTLILDRGFCSKKNILLMNKLENMFFIQPLTFSMKQVSTIIKKNKKNINSLESSFKYKEEILGHIMTDFIIDKEKFNAHIFYNEKAELDQKHKLLSKLLEIEKTTKSLIFNSQKECIEFKKDNIPENYQVFFKYDRTNKLLKRNNRAISSFLLKSGYFVMLTNNKKIKKEELLNSYRKRDMVEKMFDIEKNEMDTKRLRIHSEKNMNGRIFVKFIGLINETK